MNQASSSSIHQAFHPHESESLKRYFDLIFSSFIICLTFPLFLLIAVLIKLTSTGPVFYRHTCLGKEGKLIHCLKFRTMCIDSAEKLNQLLASSPALRLEWEKYSKLKQDPRITLIGRFLRKTSLDELPQFFNVIKGDLSVVGPRPFTQREVQKYPLKKEKILSIRPGITGIWQTSGRNLLTFEERLNLDEVYIENTCFALDIKLILKTVLMIFFPKGAY